MTKELSDLPSAIWIPGRDYSIYRGSPIQMVLEMSEDSKTVRQAIQDLIAEFERTRRVTVKLPWEQSEDTLASIYLHFLLEVGIGQPVSQA